MYGRKVALIVFYDKDKKILLQDRRNISKLGEEWGYFGGGLENNETPEKAVVRETKEELNFKLKNYKGIGNYKNRLDDGYIIDRYIFIAPLENKLSKFSLKEGKGMQLFSLEEARKLKMVSGDEKVLDMLENILWH